MTDDLVFRFVRSKGYGAGRPRVYCCEWVPLPAHPWPGDFVWSVSGQWTLLFDGARWL